MKMRPGAVATTLGLGLAGALGYIPAKALLGLLASEVFVHEALVWLALALYACFLSRWSRKGHAVWLFPLSIPLVLIFTGSPLKVFLLICMLSLSWIRSGICFTEAPWRKIATELLLCAGGGLLVAALTPSSNMGRAIGIWAFFLVQALYFPFLRLDAAQAAEKPALDAFEHARLRAERILAGR